MRDIPVTLTLTVLGSLCNYTKYCIQYHKVVYDTAVTFLMTRIVVSFLMTLLMNKFTNSADLGTTAKTTIVNQFLKDLLENNYS